MFKIQSLTVGLDVKMMFSFDGFYSSFDEGFEPPCWRMLSEEDSGKWFVGDNWG